MKGTDRTLFEAVLITTILLTALVAGLVLGSLLWSCRVSPISDRDFLQAFKRMDGVIQDKQPVFMVAGSALFSMF